MKLPLLGRNESQVEPRSRCLSNRTAGSRRWRVSKAPPARLGLTETLVAMGTKKTGPEGPVFLKARRKRPYSKPFAKTAFGGPEEQLCT